MSVDFQAFTCTVVLDNFQKKIEVLEAWDDKVLAGLGDGTLVVLQADPEAPSASWQVLQALKNFGKKYISQLQVWHEKRMLLSLCEEGVSAFKLPGFELHCQAGRTARASCFAWDSARAMLAVAAKKRLLLFHHDGSEFVELKELSLPDVVMSMAWLADSVCLGFKKEYALVNANSGAVTELFKSSAPCITPLNSSGELLLAKANVGIFLGSDGRISRKANLTWSDTPTAVAFSHPYAVALLPNYVEARSVQRVSSHGLAQVLPMKAMSVAALSTAADGILFLASGSDGGIRRLAPIPFREQAETLADADEFAEALTLAALIPDSQADDRIELANELHTRYGHRLFAEGEFDEAMAHFGMCTNANPLVLLRLFPSLAPPAMLEPLQPTIAGYKLPDLAEPSEDAYMKAVVVLLPYLLSHRSRLAALTGAFASNGQTEANATEAQRTNGDASTSGQSENAKLEDLGPDSPRRVGEAGIAQLDSEQRKLLSRAVDTAILKVMLAIDDTGALLRFVQRPNNVDLAEGERALQAAGRFSELVALYQARGQHQAALDLLRRVSQAPSELSTAPKGAAAELHGITGVWAAVKYLITIGSEVDLIKRHARWILKADPEAGLEMFVQMEHTLPPSAVLPILGAQAPSLCAPYLEIALANSSADPADYHNELARIYLRMVLNKEKMLRMRGSADLDGSDGSKADDQLRRMSSTITIPSIVDPQERLHELVMTSEHVDAEHILLMLPSGQLPELRALLLERIGQHQEALRLYVHQMQNPALAEAYCDRMFDATAKQQGRAQRTGMWGSYGNPASYEMYLALIQVYLERKDSDPRSSQQGAAPNSSNWEEVARLLGRKQDRIEPLHALQLVPGEVPLKTVLPFLEGAIKSAAEQRRNVAVVKSLRRSENLQVHEESVHCKQRSVLVTFERACSICHKRIGSAAFVAYPQGTLAHYSCFKRSEPAKAPEEPHKLPKTPVYDISF